MIEFIKTIFCKHEWCEPFMVARYRNDNVVPYEKKIIYICKKCLKRKEIKL